MRIRMAAFSLFARSTSSWSTPFKRNAIGSVVNQRSLFSSSTALHDVLSPRLQLLDKPSVWMEFTPLSMQHKSINLGQGSPDWDPPPFCIEAMKRSIDPSFERRANQYARSPAHLPFAKALAKEYSERWNVDINPETQVATAVGCSHALYSALQGMISKGDEVILLEPAFDIYPAQVHLAGGTSVFVPLRPEHSDDPTKSASEVFTLDMDELEAAITPNTKALILNTPHNPTGKMFSREELQAIADIVSKVPHMTIITDEVYEHIIFDEDHISMATLLPEQTLTLSSSGKTFSCTGWKLGWAVGPPHLVKSVRGHQQWVTYCAPTPTQDAMAQCLEIARERFVSEDGTEFETYYHYLQDKYKRKRGLLLECLEAGGMTPVMPPGSFFIMADTSHMDFPDEGEVTEAMPTNPMPRDWALSRWMTKNIGVTAIPPSAFYSTPNIPLAKNLLRFAFCKNDDALIEAKQRFEKFFG